MANRYFSRTRSRRWAVTTVLALLATGWAAPRPAAAGELDKLDTSLKLVADDAAFYCAMLRNREQFEAVAKSRAVAKIKDMPAVKMALALWKLQTINPEGFPAKLKAAMTDPENREAVETLAEMVSDEVFFYGDESFVGVMKLFQAVNFAQSYGAMILQLGGTPEDVAPGKIQPMMILGAVYDNLDLLNVPGMVVGFKIKDADRAKQQLDRLEELLTEALKDVEVEEVKDSFKRTKVDGHEYLVLSLDAKMLPWDEFPMDKFEEYEPDDGATKKVIDRIKQQKIIVALGVREDYVLLSVGPSTDILAKLGTGKPLGDRPEFKPLAKFADKRLTSISYVSEAMMRQVGNPQGQMDELAKVVDKALSLSKLTDKQQAEIRKDVAAVAGDLKGLMPETGSVMGFEFLTDDGIEAYKYNRSKNFQFDGSKPLGLLEHVGGSPILAVVARGKDDPRHHDTPVKWAKIAYRYFRTYALPRMSEDERKRAEKFIKLMLPLVKRVDDIRRTKLIPALADGQGALVIDAKLTSKQFHESMPATDEPMPMVEPAIVIGVSDAALLRAAGAEFMTVLDDFVDVVRQMEPESLPEDFKFPRPKVAKATAGTVCTYDLPESWGVDKKITPSFGLSDHVAVVAASRDHVERLLEATPPAAGGVLAQPQRPRAMAVVFDWPALLEAAQPWVDLAVETLVEQFNGDVEAVSEQVETVMEVLGVLRKITSEAYFEGDALVSHTLIEIRDVEE